MVGLIIIPARKGSKRLKNKNKLKFLGKPLIEHTFNFAKNFSFIYFYIFFFETFKHDKKYQSFNNLFLAFINSS